MNSLTVDLGSLQESAWSLFVFDGLLKVQHMLFNNENNLYKYVSRNGFKSDQWSLVHVALQTVILTRGVMQVKF